MARRFLGNRDSVAEFTEVQPFFLAGGQQFIDRHILQSGICFQQCPLEGFRHLFQIAVRAAHRFLDDTVNQPDFLQALRCQAQSLRSLIGTLSRLPQDRCAAFRRNHRIDGVLEHLDNICNRNRQCTARTAFPNHRRNERHLDFRHLIKIAADGLRLPAFLGINTRERTRGIDKGENRQAELLCRMHQAERLPVTFWQCIWGILYLNQ